MDFNTAVKHIFKSEGGLVDHPHDPGGITKYGISQRAYPHLSRNEIKGMTKERAGAIYKKDYWDPMHCDELPGYLRLMAFDCAINQGVSYSTRALQASVAAVVDGAIGPNTIRAAHEVRKSVGLRRYAINRFQRYLRHPRWTTFRDGWIDRLFKVTIDTLL